MIFTVEITDPSLLAGITDSRNAHNLALPLNVSEKIEDHPDYKATDNDYVSFIITKAAESYAKQFGVTMKDLADLEAKVADVKSKLGIVDVSTKVSL